MNFIIKHILRLHNTIKRNLKMLSLKLQYGDNFQYEKFHFRANFSVLIEKTGKISIGRNCFFNNGCSITALDTITIGNNCIFGENVKIYDHNHCYKDKNILIKDQGFSSAPITINNDCWFGTNVTILKGVTIGSHSVIGTGVIIYKDVPAYSTIICEQNLHNL